MHKGTVKFFEEQKGYGFIVNDEGKDVYVHISGINKQDKILAKGDRVTYNLIETDRGTRAINVNICG